MEEGQRVCSGGLTLVRPCIIMYYYIRSLMKTFAGNIYHIYNQGNNRQRIFFNQEDYFVFLKKYRELVAKNCETLCYCLMPNHFHFLIYATEKSEQEKKLGSISIQNLSDGFRRMLSIYAHELNE